jgi:Holliday junction resolvase-like predicted endonuclease
MIHVFLQRRMINAILEVSVDGRSFSPREIMERARVGHESVMNFLGMLIDEGLLGGSGESYYIKVPRYLLIQHLHERGFTVDPESVARYFTWREFEDFVSFVFQTWGFRVVSRFRLISYGLEIDVVALRRPYLVLVEVKHWSRARSTREVVRTHLIKVRKLLNDPQLIARKLSLDWDYAVIIPLVVTWHDVGIVVKEGVPVVGIIRLNSLLQQFESIIDAAASFRINWDRLCA